MDSFLAVSTKPQELTIRTSASSALSAQAQPEAQQRGHEYHPHPCRGGACRWRDGRIDYGQHRCIVDLIQAGHLEFAPQGTVDFLAHLDLPLEPVALELQWG